MNDSDRRDLADRCAREVVTNGKSMGLSESDLLRSVADLRALTNDDRFIVLTKLAQHKYVASNVIAGEWRFWARHRAPAGAYMASV